MGYFEVLDNMVIIADIQRLRYCDQQGHGGGARDMSSSHDQLPQCSGGESPCPPIQKQGTSNCILDLLFITVILLK